MEKPADYYSKDRSDLLPLLLPVERAAVLDVGCGAGGLGRLLRENGCGALYGVESAGGAAVEARKTYDRIYTESIERVDLGVDRPFFDLIVCADVLEHLTDPWAVLRKLRDYLKPTGYLVASIPNVRHSSIVGGLLCGSFDYQGAGILDQTHLRFFAPAGMKKLFENSGFAIRHRAMQYDSNYAERLSLWKRFNMPARLQEMTAVLNGQDHSFTDDELLEFMAVQCFFKVQVNPGWNPEGK